MRLSCLLLTQHSLMCLPTASFSLLPWLRWSLAYSSCTMADQAPCMATLQSDCAMPKCWPPQRCLVVLFSAAFSAGQVPQSWNISLVTPSFMQGHATDTANHRPISVGEPISRPCASIMVQCLVKYTEQQRLRSSTQTGCLAPSTLPLPFSMSSTSTGTPTSLSTSALLISNQPMTSFSAICGLLQRLGAHMLGAIPAPV